jgi:hypothetical protein
VKVAAYQAPLLPPGSREAVDLIRSRVDWCESHGVAILCCQTTQPHSDERVGTQLKSQSPQVVTQLSSSYRLATLPEKHDESA